MQECKFRVTQLNISVMIGLEKCAMVLRATMIFRRITTPLGSEPKLSRK